MINKYFVQVRGQYSLGVNSIPEAILAAWGDYSHIEGIGYPSIIGEFFEVHSSEYAYNVDTLDYENRETLELLTAVIQSDVKIYSFEDGKFEDVTETLYQFPRGNLEVARLMWETKDA